MAISGPPPATIPSSTTSPPDSRRSAHAEPARRSTSTHRKRRSREYDTEGDDRHAKRVHTDENKPLKRKHNTFSSSIHATPLQLGPRGDFNVSRRDEREVDMATGSHNNHTSLQSSTQQVATPAYSSSHRRHPPTKPYEASQSRSDANWGSRVAPLTAVSECDHTVEERVEDATQTPFAPSGELLQTSRDARREDVELPPGVLPSGFWKTYTTVQRDLKERTSPKTSLRARACQCRSDPSGGYRPTTPKPHPPPHGYKRDRVVRPPRGTPGLRSCDPEVLSPPPGRYNYYNSTGDKWALRDVFAQMQKTAHDYPGDASAKLARLQRSDTTRSLTNVFTQPTTLAHVVIVPATGCMGAVATDRNAIKHWVARRNEAKRLQAPVNQASSRSRKSKSASGSSAGLFASKAPSALPVTVWSSITSGASCVARRKLGRSPLGRFSFTLEDLEAEYDRIEQEGLSCLDEESDAETVLAASDNEHEESGRSSPGAYCLDDDPSRI
ncbi:hypothetical protein K466DRAFT_658270 [Polyporus arcularius HHB13444]|uniref:Uncharacterized protein n=1 Tax=Polyporus arcularius HHB13444 TaxID=1314778 RepID=A0A5C3PYG3_9APHY|nr:hypothetical protein K466DRAFT_658270 [Polyporus arcularius HHB13444]